MSSKWAFGVVALVPVDALGRRRREPDTGGPYECWCGREFPTFAGTRRHQSVNHAHGLRSQPGAYWRLVDSFYARYGRVAQR